MKKNFCLFKAMFLTVLFFCVIGLQPAKADEIMDFALYQGLLTEDGAAINDGWWVIYDVYGRDIKEYQGEREKHLWEDRHEVMLILEVDPARNLVASIPGEYDGNGELDLWEANLIEIQDNHIILHGNYDFDFEEQWIFDPAPRFPRFFKPGEGFFWELNMQVPQENVHLQAEIDFTFLGKGLAVPSTTLPGDAGLENVALLTFKEQGRVYENGVLMDSDYRNIQEARAPGKGMVWMLEHVYFSEQWEGVQETGVETIVVDSVVDWGRGDYPEILQDLDIEGMRATLAGLPLATNIQDVPKTGETPDPLTDLQKANILFNWLESQVPILLSPTPQPTHVDEGLIWRSYQDTGTAVGIMQNNLHYLDENGELHDLGPLDDWLSLAMPQG